MNKHGYDLSCDVLINGAGLVGSTCALSLAQNGLDVLILTLDTLDTMEQVALPEPASDVRILEDGTLAVCIKDGVLVDGKRVVVKNALTFVSDNIVQTGDGAVVDYGDGTRLGSGDYVCIGKDFVRRDGRGRLSRNGSPPPPRGLGCPSRNGPPQPP